MSSNPEPVRLALVGAGAIAQVAHLPILSRMRRVELTAICDDDRSRARTIADRFGVGRVCRTPEELWTDPEIDGVLICTPSYLHAEQSRAALEAGKYVLCEKPLGLSAEEARSVLEAPGADTRLMVAMNQRYRADVTTLKPFVAGAELGRVYYLRAGWLNRRVGRARRSWRQRRTMAGGGALMDLGYQMLDLALWVLDYPEPQRVLAHVYRAPGMEVEEAGVLLVTLADGRVVNLEVTWNLLAERERQYLHLLADAGSASLSPLSVYKELDGQLLELTPTLSPSRENQYTASYRQELLHFVETVRGEREVRKPAEHLTLLRIIEAAYRSAAEGREVEVAA
jgi:predicted dehydrogenase